jgi:hypothetical protein
MLLPSPPKIVLPSNPSPGSDGARRRDAAAREAGGGGKRAPEGGFISAAESLCGTVAERTRVEAQRNGSGEDDWEDKRESCGSDWEGDQANRGGADAEVRRGSYGSVDG